MPLSFGVIDAILQAVLAHGRGKWGSGLAHNCHVCAADRQQHQQSQAAPCVQLHVPPATLNVLTAQIRSMSHQAPLLLSGNTCWVWPSCCRSQDVCAAALLTPDRLWSQKKV
jgi:hypothetical protein